MSDELFNLYDSIIASAFATPQDRIDALELRRKRELNAAAERYQQEIGEINKSFDATINRLRTSPDNPDAGHLTTIVTVAEAYQLKLWRADGTLWYPRPNNRGAVYIEKIGYEGGKDKYILSVDDVDGLVFDLPPNAMLRYTPSATADDEGNDDD